MTFIPGQSGNPGGRPKSAKLFRDALLAELKRADGDAERIHRVAKRLVENALGGETAAIKEIADRIDGKVPQAMIGSDEPTDAPMRMVIQWQTGLRSQSKSPTSPEPPLTPSTPESSAGPSS